ncbi:MAG: hypothetical protein QOJ40_186 [Verrucomicrobiota bacterium]
MKMDHPKEWWEERLDLEGDSEVGAGGGPPWVKLKPGNRSRAPATETRIVLGTLVSLWRRNQGWSAEQLAQRAGIALETILDIEHDPHCEPAAEVVRILAELLEVPAQPLLELAGLAKPRTPQLREEAVRFAARSEALVALNPNEKAALETFVSAIKKSGEQAG